MRRKGNKPAPHCVRLVDGRFCGVKMKPLGNHTFRCPIHRCLARKLPDWTWEANLAFFDEMARLLVV